MARISKATARDIKMAEESFYKVGEEYAARTLAVAWRAAMRKADKAAIEAKAAELELALDVWA